MVNDGSTDSCPQIMAEYSDRYSNFISIHQENQGLSAARNTGLQHAIGEFVSFFDSDDRLAPTFLQELYEACQRSGADIACCNHIRYYPRNGFRCPVLITARSGVYSQKHALNTLLRDMFLHHFAGTSCAADPFLWITISPLHRCILKTLPPLQNCSTTPTGWRWCANGFTITPSARAVFWVR